MKNLKTLLCFLILGILLFASACSELDDGEIKRFLGNIDISQIANEEDKQIVEVFDRYGYIPLSNEYYTVSSIEENISDDILINTSYVDLKYAKLNEKYNSDYYKNHALIIVPFKTSANEIEKGISVNSVYANMDGGVIVFNVDSELEDDSDIKTITFLFEIEYAIIDLDKIIGVDIESLLGFNVNITPSLFSEYVNNIQIMVNNKNALNDIDNLEGSKFYKSYKELVSKDILVVEGYDNERVEILKNFKMSVDGDTYEEKTYVSTYKEAKLFKDALENVKFVRGDAFFDVDEYMYQITFGYITIQIIDAHHFDYWRFNHFMGTCEIVEGSFAFVNKFFDCENEALNDFLAEVYAAIEYLTNARLVGSEKLNMLYEFCEIVKKWECIEDFGDYNIIDQLKIVLDNIQFEQEMETEIENATILLEELLKDVQLKQRRFINLDYGDGTLEKFKVFENQEYVLPIPTLDKKLFCGWYDEDGKVWSEGIYPFNEDITLYAKWVDASNYQLGVSSDSTNTKTYRSIKKYLGNESVVVIPSHDEFGYEINYIDFAAFEGNGNIEKVYFSYTMKELDVACFRACVNLKEVYLGENMEYLGFYAFANCRNLTYVYFPEGITNTGLYTFHNCYALESIEFPSTINSYGVNLFQGCVNLRSLSVREGGRFSSVDNCIMNGTRLVIGCKTSVIPNNTTWIDSYAFYYVHFENEIVLPETLTWIREGAFYGTSGLDKIIIPASVKSVEGLAFVNVAYDIYVVANEKQIDWNDRWTFNKVVYGYSEN